MLRSTLIFVSLLVIAPNVHALLRLEAESAKKTSAIKLKRGSSYASKGKYLVMPTSKVSAQSVTFKVRAIGDGTLSLVARVSGSASQNSFDVKINNEKTSTFHYPAASRWIRKTVKSSFKVKKGDNIVRFIGREGAAKIDYIEVKRLTFTEKEGRSNPPTIAPSFRPSNNRTIASLKVDRGFNPSSLSREEQIWLERALRAQGAEKSKKNDSYTIGRSVNMHLTSLMIGLRLTGDERFLEEISDILKNIKGHLAYHGDKYLNLIYVHENGEDPTDFPFVGTDRHVMDEIMSHSGIAAATYALYLNRDLSSTYRDQAEFFTDYLQNHFEAKWRVRNRKPSGFPFMGKDLFHPFTQFIRYHHYMGKLTGDSGYTAEAVRMGKLHDSRMKTTSSNVGDAFVWDHMVSRAYKCQSYVYIPYTMAGMTDLHFEGFGEMKDVSYMTKVANGFSQFAIHGPTDLSLKADVCGEKNRGGVISVNRSRAGSGVAASRGYSLIGRFDRTGDIEQWTRRLYEERENNSSAPSTVHLPIAMLMMLMK